MKRAPPRTTKTTVLLTFDRPYNVTIVDLRNYIIDELESAGGSRHPEDPLFHSLQNVHVSKPITVWRDPTLKKKSNVVLLKNNENKL